VVRADIDDCVPAAICYRVQRLIAVTQAFLHAVRQNGCRSSSMEARHKMPSPRQTLDDVTTDKACPAEH
jgi:hypothetical protein